VKTFLATADLQYSLPPERIAQEPLEQRDASKLLIYRGGAIRHSHFLSLADFLPDGSTMVFNDTRVIPARLIFRKESGAKIEIFLLAPVLPSPLAAVSLAAPPPVCWECAIGNRKRWKSGELTMTEGDLTLHAYITERKQPNVHFRWDPAHLTFSEVLQRTGAVPLPPYIRRKAEPSDTSRYQTIFALRDGAVAAPTAALHFTEAVFQHLNAKSIKREFVTLHVSAGTFLPIQGEDASAHIMHAEQISVSAETVMQLMTCEWVTAVGTTSLRTLESLYWWAARLERDPGAPFRVRQHDPYELSRINLSRRNAFERVLTHMQKNRFESITGESALYILPGYTFRMADALVTNFHQPGSTLIALVAAFVGDSWRIIYNEALKTDYRFLSYGDSSLLIP
jgi:S-adenosylmethionine:tRNA ribosyltransferase-isomerase